MADVTATLNDVLQSKGAKSIGNCHYSFDQVNDFLKQAYSINKKITDLLSYLRTIRQPYLSTAPPPRKRLQASLNHNDRQPVYFTDKQRDIIDTDAKNLLRDLSSTVTALQAAEEARQIRDESLAKHKRARAGLGALGRWAAGGILTEENKEETAEQAQANGVKAHTKSVIWFLKHRLAECGQLQHTMQQIRIDRQTEKSKSVLYKTRGSDPVPVWEDDIASGFGMKDKAFQNGRIAGLPAQEFENSSSSQDNMNEEQMQLFAKENQDMLKHYENKIDQVRTAEKSIQEISELQTTLAQNLSEQSEMIDQLIQDSYTTTENVGTGNKELKKASERRSMAKLAFYATAGVCSFFIVWDLII